MKYTIASFIVFIVLCRCSPSNQDEPFNNIFLDSLTHFNSVDEVIATFGQEEVQVLDQRTDNFPGPSCILYPGTKNQVIFRWDIAERKRPTKFVIVSLSSDELPNPNSLGRWKTANGLRLGMSLQEAEKINGAPFDFNFKHARSDGAGTDEDPTGELAGVTLWFEPGFETAVGTSSDAEAAQGANPGVFTIVLHREMIFATEAAAPAATSKEIEQIQIEIREDTPNEDIARALDAAFAKKFAEVKTGVELIAHKVFMQSSFLHPDGECWRRYIAQLLAEQGETKDREYLWYAIDGISPGYYLTSGIPVSLPERALTDPGIPPELLFDFSPENRNCTAVGIKTQQGIEAETKVERLSVYEIGENDWQEIFTIALKALEPIDPTEKAPEYHDVVRTVTWPALHHGAFSVAVKNSKGDTTEKYVWENGRYERVDE